jgi:hypothetical protein
VPALKAIYEGLVHQAKELVLGKKSMVVEACHPSYSGGGGRKILVQGWPKQKCKTLSKKKKKKN